MTYVLPCLALTIAALAFPASGLAQEPGASPTAEGRSVTEAPVVDGDVLGDPVWQGSQVLTGFWQTAPDEGQPSSERTEIRIVYTTDTLYFGVVCYDSDPSTIVVNESRRDSQLDEDDSFRIILDTYRDRQNGFVFGTNPAGLEYDGQVVNEGGGDIGGPGPGGGGGRQQGGSSAGFNLNWDAPWRVSSRISEIGWSAEFAIPFRSLRYPGGDTQMWGLNFQRTIRRRNESAFWSPLPRQFNLYRLSLAGSLAGLRVPPQRNLAVTPYALGESRLTRRGPDNTDLLGNAGIDLKYSITPSLALDATVNTDFAQVEVDEEQINLDRFNLFFPEKRPFFLENAGLFAVGSPGEAEVFFSRRIGIADDGHLIPILGGARVTGRIAGTSVGLLNMQTEADSTTPSNNFSVVRINRELPNRSAFGGIVVNRQGTGRIARVDDYNRSYALDGRLGIGATGLISGFAADTTTPGIGGRTTRSGSARAATAKWRRSAAIIRRSARCSIRRSASSAAAASAISTRRS